MARSGGSGCHRAGLDEAAAIVDGRLPVTPLNLLDVLGSWPVYLERGRRGFTAALPVVVSERRRAGRHLLVDRLGRGAGQRASGHHHRGRRPASRRGGPGPGPTLSFIFDPNTRIGTVGGGLMDQVATSRSSTNLCRPHGLDFYLDDFRYTWWRSHNGFEASRLAPELDRKRITKLVSPALIESFRADVLQIRMPWVYSQSPHVVRLRSCGGHGRHLRLLQLTSAAWRSAGRSRCWSPRRGGARRAHPQPPTPVCFYTTQQRIPIRPESAVALRRVFGFHHLEANGADPDVARTADLLRSAPHVAFHVRRGDYLHPHFDTGAWHARARPLHRGHRLPDRHPSSGRRTSTWRSSPTTSTSSRPSMSDYGLDRVSGQVRFIRGNRHYNRSSTPT